MRFQELNEQDRIQYIKDEFVLIIEQLVKDPTKISNYIVAPEAPKQIKAVVEKATESMTDDDKTKVLERNKLAADKVSAENEKLMKDYTAIVEQHKKTMEFLSKIKKKPGCICESCIDLSITNGIIPNELEVLIDAARKEIENRQY